MSLKAVWCAGCPRQLSKRSQNLFVEGRDGLALHFVGRIIDQIGVSEIRRYVLLNHEWVAPGLNAAIARPDLVSHTRQLAERIAARVKICLGQARLSASDIDAVFLTGGSVRLAHVRKAITKAVPSARIVEGDTFGAVGKGLTLEALRRYGPRD